jgi:hypothetical protein
MAVGGVPLWVFFVILLIFISGYMAFRAFYADKQQDKQFIEREGQIYMERMSEEKKERALSKQQENN